MIVDSHLLISQILYKYLFNQMNFKLNRVSFAFGNIKPDFINKDINRSHTLYQSLYCFNKYSEELMNRNVSIKEFSMYLGVTCHFACDYFCIYHREGNDKKNIFEHLFYELVLHVKLITLLLKGEINLNKCKVTENSVEAIVMRLQESYNSEPRNLTRDITYALFAASQISKLIVCRGKGYEAQGAVSKTLKTAV